MNHSEVINSETSTKEESKLSDLSGSEASPVEKYVIKRNGTHQKLDLQKLYRRFER